MPSPEFDAVFAAIAAQPVTLPADVHEARMRMDEMLGSSPLADGVEVAAVADGPCPAEWLIPAGAQHEPVVLYLHGGGYRIGSIAGYRPLLSQFAVAFGMRLLAVEYRLAPEHPFPAAVDDALAAYRWLLDHDTPASAIAIMGDSAGGGLAAACVLAIKAARLPQPGAVVCLSPLADLTLAADSYRRNAATDPYWNLTSAQVSVTDYLAGARARDPLASPVFGNFARTAPMLIHAASGETLADDAVHLAGAVHRSKGQVRCELWPDMTHVWHALYPHVPEARAAVEAVTAFLREHLA